MIFAELLSPSICAGCLMFGGGQIGVEAYGVDFAVGWVDHHLQSGKMDDDTLRASVETAFWRRGPYSAGLGVAEVFTPDGKPKPGHLPIEPELWAGARLAPHFEIRLRGERHSASFGLRYSW